MSDEQLVKFLKSSEYLRETAPPPFPWPLVLVSAGLIGLTVTLTIWSV